MQQSFSQNLLNINAQGLEKLNANSLISSSRSGIKAGKTSFANELLKLQNETADSRVDSEKLENKDIFDQKELNLDSNKKVPTKNLSAAIKESINPEAEIELKKLQDKETIQEIKKQAHSEEALKDSQELSSKFHSSENTIAQALQHHQKEITEAYKEGNLAEQQNHYDHSQERKKQLANWEDLAPRIIEDPKNRAVRIDIPGLVELETIIVRTKQGEVSIQTVGEKNIMERLQSQENLLSKKLREKNIQLGTLQTFDAAAISAGARKKQA